MPPCQADGEATSFQYAQVLARRRKGAENKTRHTKAQQRKAFLAPFPCPCPAKAAMRPPKEPASLEEAQQLYIGRPVCKEFQDATQNNRFRPFTGICKAIWLENENGAWALEDLSLSIEYEDGDTEDVGWDEFKTILVPERECCLCSCCMAVLRAMLCCAACWPSSAALHSDWDPQTKL